MTTRHTTPDARLSSREAHSALWCLALLLGPEEDYEWQLNNGERVEAHECLRVLAEHVARLDAVRAEASNAADGLHASGRQDLIRAVHALDRIVLICDGEADS